METTVQVLLGLIAVVHVWFLVLEMFLWCKPIGLKTFNKDLETAKSSQALAANIGLYNGFLAAGLAWGLLDQDPGSAFSIRMFFLTCVAVAGVFGAATASRRIFWVQALPALIALALIISARG